MVPSSLTISSTFPKSNGAFQVLISRAHPQVISRAFSHGQDQSIGACLISRDGYGGHRLFGPDHHEGQHQLNGQCSYFDKPPAVLLHLTVEFVLCLSPAKAKKRLPTTATILLLSASLEVLHIDGTWLLAVTKIVKSAHSDQPIHERLSKTQKANSLPERRRPKGSSHSKQASLTKLIKKD